ncbi:MAG: MFS transporter [Lentisphaeria bacterium]|nr:MFS transporter [Lentisphaeria bacterium]
METQTINWKKNLFASWIGQILALGGHSAIMPFIPLFIQEKYHITDEKELGVWVSAMTFFGLCSFCFSNILWGVLADKYGRKLMLLRSYYVAALLFPLMYFSPNVLALVGMRFLASCFSGSVTASQTLIITTTPKEHHGFALGTLSTAVWSGSMLGYLFGALFVNAFGYFWGFMSCGILYLVGGIITHICVKENFVPPVKTEKKKVSFWKEMKHLSSAVWIIFLLFIFMGMARRMDEPYIAMLVSQLSPSGKAIFYTGVISFVAAVGGLFSGILFGKLCDRFSPGHVAIPATIISAITMLLQAFSNTLLMLGGVRFIHYTAASGLEPAFQALLARLVPDEKRGTLLGVASSLRVLGIMLSSLLCGGLICIAGSVRIVFAGAAVLFLILLGLVCWTLKALKKLEKQQKKSEIQQEGDHL